ncbi:MAG: thioesterase family protein [Pseudomonadota bacterium]
MPFYARETQQILRYGDTDRQGHINNAVYSTLFESGRVGVLFDAAKGLPPAGHSFVLAQLNISFVTEMFWPATVTIGTNVAKIGTSSVRFAQGVYVGENTHATAESVVVFTNTETRKSTPIPTWIRDYLNELSISE